jgi:hypothetical protein
MYPWPIADVDYEMQIALDIALDYLEHTGQAVPFSETQRICAHNILRSWREGTRLGSGLPMMQSKPSRRDRSRLIWGRSIPGPLEVRPAFFGASVDAFWTLFLSLTCSSCTAHVDRSAGCAVVLGDQMVVKQWMHNEYRIDLQLVGSDYLCYIYEPGNSEKLSYTPVVEMKHGQGAAEIAAEAFIDERMKKKALR